jgi:hypothetical protein
MIHYIEVPEKKMIIAELRDTGWDALNKISKMFDNSKISIGPESFADYLMPTKFTTSVTLQDGDEYNIEVGKTEAKNKLMNHYYASLDKRVDRFKAEFLKFAKDFCEKNAETY